MMHGQQKQYHNKIQSTDSYFNDFTKTYFWKQLLEELYTQPI